MAISIRCKNPDCGKPCRVNDEHAGKAVKCPACGQRITVPSQKPAPPSRGPAEEPAPRVEPSAPRRKDPDRSAHRAVWPWLAGLAAMLLVGVGGGYFLATSQTKKAENPPGQTDPKSQELAAANADLTKRLATADEKVKDVLAANATLTKRLAVAEEKAQADAPEGKVKPKTDPVKTKEDEPKAKGPLTEKDPLAERVADEILARWMSSLVSNWTAQQVELAGDKLGDFLLTSRFSGTDETLEMRLAHRFILFGGSVKVGGPQFEMRVKDGLREMAEVQKRVGADAKSLDSLVKSEKGSFIQQGRLDLGE